MGLDISKITNATLKKLATEKDYDGNENLNYTEFSVFKLQAKQLEGVSKKDLKETFGLYVSNPEDKNDISVQTKKEEKSDTKLTKEEKKYNKEVQNVIESRIQNYIKEKSSITTETLVESLNKEFSDEDYKEAIKQVQSVVDFVKETKFDSKDDVKDLEKKIKNNKNFNEYQRDLANEFVEIAKKEQINKEAVILTSIYETVKADSAEVNYTKYLEAVENEMKNRNLAGKSYYSKEALNQLKAIMITEVQTWAQREMDKLNNDNTTATKKKHIISEIKNKLPESDKFAKNVVSEMDSLARVAKNRVNYERNYDENLGSINKEALRKSLGRDTFHKINGNHLQTVINKENGTYNLRQLADIVRGATGADWEMNTYGDEKRSEMQKAIDDLKDAIKRGDVTADDVKKLKKLCKIEDAPKSREAKDVFGNIVNGAVAGALLGPLGAIEIKSVAEATTILVNAGASASVSLGWTGAAIAPVLIGLDALINTIVGVKKDEETCFKFEDAAGKTVEEYIAHLEKHADSEEQAKAIAVLAKAYEAKYKNDWNTHFVNDLKNAAGNDLVLNCKEFKSAHLSLMDNLKTEEASYNTYDQNGTPDTKEAVEIETINARTSSWAKLAEQYSCIGDIEIDATKYPNCAKRKGQLAVRMLKVAQAINDNNYSLERLLYLAEETFKSPNYKYESLKEFEGIDHKVLQGTMKAELMGDVKMPSELAGCRRDNTKDIKATVQDKTGKVAAVASAKDYVKKLGKSGEYGVRFNYGEWKKFNTANERDKELEKFKKQNPQAKRDIGG